MHSIVQPDPRQFPENSLYDPAFEHDSCGVGLVVDIAGIPSREIVDKSHPDARFSTSQTLAGNTILYGATGGQLFIAGTVGECFMVRNSGSVAVVEGTGDHACEYMTGGRAVILGPTGRNFGAGMTNGEVWVYDPEGTLDTHINAESVCLERMDERHVGIVHELIERHVKVTGSRSGQSLLDRWPEVAGAFRHVMPKTVRVLEDRPESSLEGGVAD